MKTQRFEVARLRGMDQRWRTTADSAALIKEMTWSGSDGWKVAGSYDLITGSTYDWSPGDLPNGNVTSIHYFTRHNGAQRFIVFENQLGQLNVITPHTWDRIDTVDPFRFLKYIDGRIYNGNTVLGIKRFVPKSASVGTQSVAFGSRLYMVNGHDDPIVFDGKRVYRAGFGGAPSAPSPTVVFRAHYDIALYNEEPEKPYFLGTKIKGQGLGSLSPKGAILNETAKKQNKDNINRRLYLDAKPCGYQYKVTFVNSRGQESPMSEPSQVCRFECAAGMRRFVSVTLPIGDENVVARRLYRTMDLLDDYGNALSVGNATNFHFVKEIQDNETTVIEDGLSDDNLGSIRDPEDFGEFPTGAKYIASFKNTVFVAGMSDNILRFSAPGMPEIFPKDNLFDIGNAEAGQITGLYASTNALIVFKENGVYFVKGSPQTGFVLQTLTRDVGCIAPNSVKDVPGTGLMFLSASGVFVIKGMLEDTNAPTQIVDLSTPIKELLSSVCTTSSEFSVGALNKQNKEYLLCVPTLGKLNNLLLVWHYEIGSWSIRENYPISCATEVRGRTPFVFFGSHDETKYGIHVLSDYFRIKNEKGSESGYSGRTEIIPKYSSVLDFPLYETAPFSFNEVYSAVQVGYINVYAVAYGDNEIKLNFKVNRSELVSLDKNKGMIQQHHDQSEHLSTYYGGIDEIYPFKGSGFTGDVTLSPSVDGQTFSNFAKFDNGDKFGFYRPVVIRFDVSHMHKALTNEFSIQFTQDDSNLFSNRLAIVGYSVDLKVGEQRKIRSLTDALKSNRV